MPETKLPDTKQRSLVIVESPAKARTIARFLGPEFAVESSIGHIRDLPERAADVPAEHKRKPWARLGVDVEQDFSPLYVVSPEKKKVVAELRKRVLEANEVLLATDEDREGEAIAWHLSEVLQPKVPVRRMVFHEITREAIERALEETRQIDERLVDAQETRRIVDRLYGYEVSPVLWKKVMTGLSAGRVQSVATRLVVERERERMGFTAAAWWDLEATFDPGRFSARLTALGGRRLAQGRDFARDGTLADAELVRLEEQQARSLAERLRGEEFRVAAVERKPYTRRPAAPFMTSTLQQEASRKLRFTAQTTMRVAQRLYEGGYITYMRTDSTTLAESALAAARERARSLYGAGHVPEQPRRYDRKVKNAQEAHEAIRPAGDHFRLPADLAGELSGDELALYDLIWRRTIASQMADAKGETVSLRIAAAGAEFSASGTTITFRGFLAAYEEGRDDTPAREEEDAILPPLSEGDVLQLRKLEPQEHRTTPPPRYTEATLIRTLEELGIGRPSTYASIIGTILDRGYVWKRGTALVPSFVAFSVVALLERHFRHLVDYDFTARMEDDLDRIAGGEEERVEWLRRFYFGADGGAGLHELVQGLSEIDARAVNCLEIGDDIVVRVGRYGPFVEKGERRASVPEDLAPDELTVERAEQLLSQQVEQRSLGGEPEILLRVGRYGPYVEQGEKRASLPPATSLDQVTAELAHELLSFPKTLGEHEGVPVTVHRGRYGPYVQQGKETRSLEEEEQAFTVTLDQALALLAQPKARGRRQAAAPLRELGTDPTSHKPVTVKAGRFGPYVTDGETNASLRKGDDTESITLDRALELLAERRAKGPAPKRRRRAPSR
ncbi:MAG: type I DNA topoisomerase [Thermoleophilia bacterium]|nr:type I DNA topoisomerase [Thermoleophilia bacterium]